MQEIKTIWQDVSTQDRCKFADALLNDHLSDGWAILNIATSATHEDGGIYRAVMLVRDIMAAESAPVETPAWAVGDRFFIKPAQFLHTALPKYAGKRGVTNEIFDDVVNVTLDGGIPQSLQLNEIERDYIPF